MSSTVNQTQHTEQPLFTWEFREYERPARSRAWYITALLIGLFLIIYSIITSNLLFALIVLLCGFILLVREYIEPTTIVISITEDGISMGNKFYPYKDLAEFYIIYEPPLVKRLYLKSKFSAFKLSVPLHDQDPVAIREVLLKYVKEDTETEYESLTDSIEQILKL